MATAVAVDDCEGVEERCVSVVPDGFGADNGSTSTSMNSHDWMYQPSPSVQRMVSLPFLEAEITVVGHATGPAPSMLEHWRGYV